MNVDKREVVQVASEQSVQGATPDNELDTKRHNRAYNPVDEADRTQVSAALNADVARMRSGPSKI